MESSELIAFEKEIAAAFESKLIPAPVHLSGGNEAQLIDIFQDIDPWDWVFCTYRNHYHALLHGLPRNWVKAEILAGRSMTLSSPAHHFFTSAIVGGHLSIAVGVAQALKLDHSTERVWCFCGDMAARSGVFHEATQLAAAHGLPIEFIVEDNGFSTDTPTRAAWGGESLVDVRQYQYSRLWPHVNTGKWIDF